MKKLTSLFFLFILVFCSCQSYTEEISNEQTFQANNAVAHECNYYWYNGKKIELIVDSTKNFIVYNSEKTILKKIKGGEFQKGISTTRSGGQTKASWAIVEKENCTRGTLNNIDASYKSPMYISKETGKSVGISNLIHIKLKDSKDKRLLDELESNLHISIYSQNEYLPLWYTIFCQDNLHGNSLELCNKLQESKKFAYVEPDIMVDLAQGATSFVIPNDPLYSDQWNLHGKYSINWEEASLIANGDGVKIGLVDTGVEFTHPDLLGQKVKDGTESRKQVLLYIQQQT